MRTLVAVISMILISSCGTELSQPQMMTAASLTLKMEETQANGKSTAVLMLCENDKCVNPLRDRSGGDFHFENHANLYNQKVNEAGKGQKIKMALLGITMVATAAGALLYIKSDAMRRIVGETAEKISKVTKKIDKKQRKNDHDGVKQLQAKLAQLEGSKNKLETRDNYITPTYWTTLGISALGANALAFAPGIAEDTLWQNNKRALADLFIHGSAVKVTKDELVDLLAILVEQVPATIDVAVQSYLFSI